MSVLARTPAQEKFSYRSQSFFNIPASTHLGETIRTLRIPQIFSDDATIGTLVADDFLTNTTATFGSLDLSTATFAASYSLNVDAELPRAITGTPIGTATITNSKLVLISAAPVGVSYPVGIFSSVVSQRTFRFMYTPDYTGYDNGLPVQEIIRISEPGVATGSRIEITHNTGGGGVVPTMFGQLVMRVYDVAGVSQARVGFLFSPGRGHEYDIELSFDALAGGPIRMFVDGVLMLSTGAYTFTNGSALTALTIGGGAGFTAGENFSIRNLIVLPSILHTVSYTVVPYRVVSAVIGGVIRVPQLFVNNISVGGNITAQSLTCLTAPTTSQGVVRLADLPLPLAGTVITLNGYWGPTVGNAMIQTITLQRIGNFVFANAKINSSSGTMSATDGLLYSITIPTGWYPTDIITRTPVNISFDKYLTARYNGADGQFNVYNTTDWTLAVPFIIGSVVTLPAWSLLWSV